MPKYRDPIFAKERKKHPGLMTAFILILLLAVIIFFFNVFSNSRVTLEKRSITIASLPSQAENFRILHISDLHGLTFGKDQERIKDTLKGSYYDIVCFTGDAVGQDGDYSAFLSLISLFVPDTPFYFITGDEDPAPLINTPHAGDSPKAPYIQAAEDMGAIYLDAPIQLTKGTQSLWISPEWVYSVDADVTAHTLETRRAELMQESDSPEKKAALEAIAYQEDRLMRIRAARRLMLPTDTHIAVTHHPLTQSDMLNLVDFLKSDNESYVNTISLILAGHYVGGQWRLPLIGPIKVPASSGLGNDGWFPDGVFVSGLSYSLGIAQYVTPGLGTSVENGLPGVRLFNTPSISLLTLTTRMTH